MTWAGGVRDVVLLGSTGSVGVQTLDVIERNPERFRVVALGAGGSNPDLLAEQALRHGVATVAVADEQAVQALTAALAERAAGRPVPEVHAGAQALVDLAGSPCDVVLNAITGSVGLAPTLAALAAGHTLALANKESLVVGGSLLARYLGREPLQVLPVDSEHSALAQCLAAGRRDEVARLVLTASGGPFRGRSRDALAEVTVDDALAHPTWQMGPVITVNSATLVNKGLELIEAHLLFGVGYDDIDVVVHPQSLVHSMVTFVDGSTIAQLSPPDMRLPIAIALGWPHRVPEAQPAMAWDQAHTLHFEPLDETAFPAVPLAREVGRLGGTAPGVYNAANEEAVGAFLAGALPFLGIVDTVERVVDEHRAAGHVAAPTLPEVLAAESEARIRARELLAAVEVPA